MTAWLLALALTAPPYGAWRKQIMETLHVPRPLPALDAQQHGEFQAETGVVVERVSYSTQLGMRVPTIVYRPERPSQRQPALIVVNGHGGDKYAWYANYSGIAYARLGFVVLTYDPAGEGERNSERKSGTRAHDRVVPPDDRRETRVTDRESPGTWASTGPNTLRDRLGSLLRQVHRHAAASPQHPPAKARPNPLNSRLQRSSNYRRQHAMRGRTPPSSHR